MQRSGIRQSNAVAAGLIPLCGRVAERNELPEGVVRVAEAFLEEALPEGGVDRARSLWMNPGRGSAVGSKMFQADNDPRYLRFLVEVLYRLSRLTDDKRFSRIADAHVCYMATTINDSHPSWAIGNALEVLGVYRQFCGTVKSHVESARKLVREDHGVIWVNRKSSVGQKWGVVHFAR